MAQTGLESSFRVGKVAGIFAAAFVVICTNAAAAAGAAIYSSIVYGVGGKVYKPSLCKLKQSEEMLLEGVFRPLIICHASKGKTASCINITQLMRRTFHAIVS